ncbi:M24 family metallopeptidase [Granulosicoccus sp. 3-233]|uniref:M24 family metallopeptidase n=1 Tax=Granulosicoccus sp. 3-233 TaxID=3417969 RepID=UPI003D34AE29
MSDDSLPQAMTDLSIRLTGQIVPPRGFDRREFEERARRVQANMRSADIDLLWLTSEADVRYLSGFMTQFWQSPTRPWHLLLPQAGAPVAVIPSIGLSCMQRTWVSDIRSWSSPHPSDDGVSLLIDTLTELAGSRGTIGLPMAAETQLRYPLNDFERLRAALGGSRFVDATASLRAVRQIKSAAEIEKLRHVCALVSRSFALLPELVRPGMTEVEVFRAFRILCLQQGADDVPYLVGAAGTGGYEDIISPPGDRAIGAGDVLILDTGCIFDGYHADFDRNFAIGHVDPASAAAHQRTWDATEAGLACIAAGHASCASVYDAMQSILSPDQKDKSDSGVGRLGHGLGMQLTETPSITPFDHSPLLPGMVMTLEPGYRYADGKVMVHEENLLVTDSGYELLSTRAPRDIPLIDWTGE